MKIEHRINNKKRICDLINFAVRMNKREEMKEREKLNEYVDLAKELKNLWNKMVTVIPIIDCTLGSLPKNLEKEWGNSDYRKYQDTEMLK